ncbi:hypothetical protein [Labedaea rhizosphaerae]|uniref:Flagellin-like protein n=1 Tax=Labedaea rhizosphaerae TaxID=598644 RepID=A0A4R6SEU0_LABRH|nr:hypothetical protein [Labedaea rhizosphaerae]TDP97675.1 hypothetical protein EV186_103639 [Labedaea rhizosphaerae]
MARRREPRHTLSELMPRVEIITLSVGAVVVVVIAFVQVITR